jgi:hypothetical protein
VNLRDVCGLYDDYITAGGSSEKIVDVILQLLAQVGIGDRAEDAGKNAQSQTAPLTEI